MRHSLRDVCYAWTSVQALTQSRQCETPSERCGEYTIEVDLICKTSRTCGGACACLWGVSVDGDACLMAKAPCPRVPLRPYFTVLRGIKAVLLLWGY